MGNEPVREWLRSLPAPLRKEIGADIGQVQWAWPIGKPLVDGFGGGLFEVRTSLDGNVYRVLFCIYCTTMVLLADLDLARQRMKGAED
jgi:phage-related protein